MKQNNQPFSGSQIGLKKKDFDLRLNSHIVEPHPNGAATYRIEIMKVGKLEPKIALG